MLCGAALFPLPIVLWRGHSEMLLFGLAVFQSNYLIFTSDRGADMSHEEGLGPHPEVAEESVLSTGLNASQSPQESGKMEPETSRRSLT